MNILMYRRFINVYECIIDKACKCSLCMSNLCECICKCVCNLYHSHLYTGDVDSDG